MSDKGVQVLLQLSDSPFLFLNLAVLFFYPGVFFKEFVEQHSVHRIVAHVCNLAGLVPNDQIGIYLPYVFRDQTKLGRVFGFFVV